ncbi:MAG: hypothetical protein QOI41_6369 [Myxococcales bacterium]|jgi:hypothetical protein|nr:hypothetical protein [Myxococcales bacterium]
MRFLHLSALTKPAGRPKHTGRLASFPKPPKPRYFPLAPPHQETADMLLDNLYSMMGVTGTASILFAILAFVGIPAAATVMCPKHAYGRFQRSR